MTVKEMLDLVAGISENLNNRGIDPDSVGVSIATNNPSFGSISTTEISSIVEGFDWESGRVIIHTEDKILKIKKEDKKE